MKDCIEFTIKNLNRDKVFGDLVKICLIFNIKIDNNNIKFCVNKKASKKVIKYFKQKNIKIIRQKRLGCFVFLKKTILRPGIIAPIILFFLLAIFSNFFIFKYEIMGTELLSKQDIINVLKEQNCYGFKTKASLNIPTLENSLQKIDKVSLVSVIIKGNTLVVNIKEKVYNEEYEQKDEFLPLKSNFDGIITEISVISGTCMVKVGQTVKKGQVLVDCFVVDTSGQKRNIKPMADIKADVFNVTLNQIPDQKVTFVDTGKKITQKSISCFGANIYASEPKINFEIFRVEESSLKLIKNNILPLKVKYVTYYEQKKETIDDYFNKNFEQILNSCKEKTRQLINNYDIIKEEYYFVSKVAGINNVTYTIIVNKTIT